VDGSAAPWLYAIARNVLVASVRRHHLEETARERLGILTALDRPQIAWEPSEAWLEGLDEALRELGADEREAIRLRVVDELSYDEVGLVVGTTPGAARVRVHRALSALRERLLDPKEALR
jgi:RNA polymerase sigma factor (sigma-70 family)